MYQNAIDICIFYQNLLMKNADVSRTQGVCHVIDIFFDSSLGKV